MKRAEPVTNQYASDTRERLARAHAVLDELICIRASSDPLVAAACASVRAAIVEADNAIGDMLTDVSPVPALPLDGAGVAKPKPDHRHKFDAVGVCVTCGKVKSKNGRKPGGVVAAEAPPVDTRTLPLPTAPLGGAAADRFADGGLGSSGVRR
jgi:hypothetical protein